MRYTMCAAIMMSLACSPLEEALTTSPLLGAVKIDERGEARIEHMLRAGRYTYLKLEGAPRGTWHVVSSQAPESGHRLRYRGYGELRSFHSKRLGRTFERVVFTSIQQQEIR